MKNYIDMTDKIEAEVLYGYHLRNFKFAKQYLCDYKKPVILVGPPCSGKKTMLKQLFNECKSEKKYISFINKDIDASEFFSMFIETNADRSYVLFVENIEYINQLDIYLKSIYDICKRFDVKLIATGGCGVMFIDNKYTDTIVFNIFAYYEYKAIFGRGYKVRQPCRLRRNGQRLSDSGYAALFIPSFSR